MSASLSFPVVAESRRAGLKCTFIVHLATDLSSINRAGNKGISSPLTDRDRGGGRGKK